MGGCVQVVQLVETDQDKHPDIAVPRFQGFVQVPFQKEFQLIEPAQGPEAKFLDEPAIVPAFDNRQALCQRRVQGQSGIGNPPDGLCGKRAEVHYSGTKRRG